MPAVILKRPSPLRSNSNHQLYAPPSILQKKVKQTSNKQHLRLFFDCLSTSTLSVSIPNHRCILPSLTQTNLNTIVLLIIADNIYRLFNVSQDKVAMGVVSLAPSLSILYCNIIPQAETVGVQTCNLPLNSRSPRSLTNTCSSRDRRTRSRGS